MNYLSLTFYVFIPLFFLIYYLTPLKYRYIVIFLGSYIFYGYSDFHILLLLILATTISYFGGISINKAKNKKIPYIISFMLEILLLAIYKYTYFIIDTINVLLKKFGFSIHITLDIKLLMPIGLSFIVFQTCTYLSDLYRRKISVEKNIIRYAAFVSFFPTVLSGPIQKARNLIPQITSPSKFDYNQSQKGILLFVWGTFEKIMVANRLMTISTNIIGNYKEHSSAEILIAAVCFSLYIYADFSSYSDMARGISKIMGIQVGKNFNNPYLSTTTSEFWTRWHMSLNEWFVENIYIPLGGNRKGLLRKYLNMMIIFTISGLWHGAYWHYVAWGIINGIFVVAGLMLRPLRKKFYDRCKIDASSSSVIFLKRAVVFYIITLTWVFFRAGILDTLRIWKRIIFFDYFSLFDSQLFNIAGSPGASFFVLLYTTIFCVIQYKRQNEKIEFENYCKQHFIIQCLMVSLMIVVCIFGAFATDANVDTNFLYFQF